MNFQRKPGTVFVTVPEPTPAVPSPESYERSWEQIAQRLAFETPQNSRPEASDTELRVEGNSLQPTGCRDTSLSTSGRSSSTSPIPEPEPETDTHPSSNDEVSFPEKDTPSIDEIFAESLPLFIEASRWGRYIFPGPASRILDNTIFLYHNPCTNFWDLYEMSKGIFRDLGIRLSKRGGTWVAHIPIKCLTDKVFIDSGLAASEKTLLVHTGIDPVKILNEIRQRQFQETQDGYRNVKLRQRGTVGEVIGDAVGAIAIFVGGYLAYIVGGM